MGITLQSFIGITNREEIEIRGVKDIISYDSEKIIFDMEGSELILSGDDFNIKKLDVENSISIVTGHINSLSFCNQNEKGSKSFLTSLFR